jgi:hypothetical protein
VGHIERFNPAVVAVLPLVTEPKFIEAHRLGVFVRHVAGQEFRPSRCADPFRFIQVFERPGDPVQRGNRLPALESFLSLAGLLERRLWGQGDEAVDLRFHLIDALQAGAGQLLRGCLPAGDQLSSFSKAEFGKVLDKLSKESRITLVEWTEAALFAASSRIETLRVIS